MQVLAGWATWHECGLYLPFLGQLFQPTCSFKFDKSFTLQTGDFFSLTVEFLRFEVTENFTGK